MFKVIWSNSGGRVQSEFFLMNNTFLPYLISLPYLLSQLLSQNYGKCPSQKRGLNKTTKSLGGVLICYISQKKHVPVT